ncbi:MAG TPA: ABC transporter permease [Candidatus Angelobacter sp.]|nr:ABC transporter permease [Candidatus Angelobacter sp.]
MSNLARDLRYALRAFGKSPGFIAAAILSLAIGIGATTAIFSIISALLLHPLPYKDADRLVILWNSSPGMGVPRDWFSTAQYLDIKNNQHVFEQVAVAVGGSYNITGDGEPERVGVIRVSSDLLPMFGVRPIQGRLFNPDDDRYGGPNVAILGYGIWARRYGLDPHMVGRHIIINTHQYEIVGVLPKSFSLPREVLPTLDSAEQFDMFLPMPQFPTFATDRNYTDYNVVAKLKTGVTLDEARAEMNTITARLRQDHPDVYPPNGRLTFIVLPLLEQVVGNVRHTLWLLLAAVGCVLLIACVNVANLLLSRALGRQKEIAIRTAVGASTGRVIRQLLTESVLLALCGGALGVLFAFMSIHWTHVLGPKSVPRLDEVSIRGDALLFTLLISVTSGILFGLAPALRALRVDMLSTLKDSDRGSAEASAMWGRGNNLRRILVIAELSISVVVLIMAGLLLRSFILLQLVDPGFNPSNVLTVELALSGDKYKDEKVNHATSLQFLENLERLPGVTSAGAVSSLPLSGMLAWGPIFVEGRVPPPGEKFINADERIVAGHYFETMQIPLLKGRYFNEQDTKDKPPVVIVDEFMAKQLWPNQDPLGKRISLADLKAPPVWATVVGVVGRIKQETLDSDSRVAFYMAHGQYISRLLNLVVRTTTDPASLTSAINHELHEVDHDLPLYNVVTMDQRVADSLSRRRFTAVLLALFAGFALVLATIGIYGVMAYLVNQGTREIGIRMALGATQPNVVRLVVKQGMTLALTGVVIGMVAAFAFGHLVSGLLYGVKPTDPLTFILVAVLLTIVALIASYIPARRATRIDPMVCLRCG